MINFDDVRIVCTHKKTLRDISIFLEDLDACGHTIKESEIEITMLNGEFQNKLHNYLIKTSKDEPSIKIMVFISFDYESNCQVHEMHYSNGKAKLSNIHHNYMFDNVLSKSEIPQNLIEDICDTFKKVDSVDLKEERINFLNDPVKITKFHDDFKIEAYKEGYNISFKSYRRNTANNEWKLVDGCYDLEPGELPF